MTMLLIKWPKTPCIWKHTHAQNALWRNITPQAGWFPLIIFINKEEKCNEGWKSLLVCWDLYAIIFVRKGQLSPVPKKTENNNWWCNGPDSDPSIWKTEPLRIPSRDTIACGQWTCLNEQVSLEYSTTSPGFCCPWPLCPCDEVKH